MDYASLRLAVSLSLLLPAPATIADAGSERQALARIVHELNVLTPLIASAEAQVEPNERIRFRYDWLRQDLERVREGIQAHIDGPRAEPRKLEPLRGDYRR